jgi:GNAT superfamily N-acetyltransferase
MKGPPPMSSSARIEVHPLTHDRWRDLVELFGERGANAGCWCMYFRQTSAEYGHSRTERGPRNRSLFRGLVREGREPGLLAYLDGRPVGWVSVAPRSEFGRIERSRQVEPIDDKPVWSVVCFYMHRSHRGKGVGSALLEAAVDHARRRGARIVEGYPLDPRGWRIDNPMAYPGLRSMFERAGFREVARRGHRRIMRRTVRPARKR